MMVDNRSSYSWILRLWGSLDAFYTIHYIVGSVRRGHFPFITDIQTTAGLVMEQGFLTSVLVLLNLILHFSIVFSAGLLLMARTAGVYIALAQAPLRLLFTVPSFSLLLIWAQSLLDYNLGLMLGLIIIAELIKGGILWWWLRRHRTRLRPAGL